MLNHAKVLINLSLYLISFWPPGPNMLSYLLSLLYTTRRLYINYRYRTTASLYKYRAAGSLASFTTGQLRSHSSLSLTLTLTLTSLSASLSLSKSATSTFKAVVVKHGGEVSDKVRVRVHYGATRGDVSEVFSSKQQHGWRILGTAPAPTPRRLGSGCTVDSSLNSLEPLSTSLPSPRPTPCDQRVGCHMRALA